MDFIGYDTRDKLIWTSGEGWRITNTNSKQGIPKNNINKTSTLSTLGFVCSPDKDTRDIFSEDFVSCIFQVYS